MAGVLISPPSTPLRSIRALSGVSLLVDIGPSEKSYLSVLIYIDGYETE